MDPPIRDSDRSSEEGGRARRAFRRSASVGARRPEVPEAALSAGCARGEPAATEGFLARGGQELRERLGRAVAAWSPDGPPEPDLLRRVASSLSKRYSAWPGPGQPPSLEELLGRIEIEDLAHAVACSRGREVAWQRFDRTYGGFIHRSAQQLTRRSADVDEIVASFYADLFLPRRVAGTSAISGYNGWSKLRTWLRTVLVFRINDFYTRSTTVQVPLSSIERDGEAVVPVRPVRPDLRARVDPASETFHASDLRRRLDRALASAFEELTPLEAELVVSYYVEGRTVVELGERQGVHKASVSRWLKRARERLLGSLRAALGPDFPRDPQEVATLLESMGRTEAVTRYRIGAAGHSGKPSEEEGGR